MANATNKVKNAIHNIPFSDIIDLSYFTKNKKMIITRMAILILLGAMIIPAAFLSQTRDSAAEDKLDLNAEYTGAHGSSYVVTLLTEVKDDSLITTEVLSLSQEYIDGKAEKERLAREEAERLAKEEEERRLEEQRRLEEEERLRKEAEEKAKAEAEAKKNGSYKAPPETPAEGFVYYDVPLSYEWQVYTYNLCQEFGVSFEVMLGLMNAESGFRFNVSSSVAHGICQIHQMHEAYAKSIGIDDYKAPEGNIYLGVKFLSEHLKSQNGDYHKALMCYNCGAGGAKKNYFDKGIYQSKYSQKVMSFAYNLKPVSNDN